MQYHAIPCTMNNCWRSVPLPLGLIWPFFSPNILLKIFLNCDDLFFWIALRKFSNIAGISCFSSASSDQDGKTYKVAKAGGDAILISTLAKEFFYSYWPANIKIWLKTSFQGNVLMLTWRLIDIVFIPRLFPKYKTLKTSNSKTLEKALNSWVPCAFVILRDGWCLSSKGMNFCISSKQSLPPRTVDKKGAWRDNAKSCSSSRYC